jgi:hypothetical protein
MKPLLFKRFPLLVNKYRYLFAVFSLYFVLFSNQGLNSTLNVTIKMPYTEYMVNPGKHMLHCLYLLRVTVRDEYFEIL